MIEVMVVVAILALLFSIVLVATAGYRKESARKATRALFARLDLALQKYHDLTGEYPPDGFDSDVVNDDGVHIHGSAALYYFLSHQINAKKNVAGEIRLIKEEPPMEFKSRELIEDSEEPGVFEIIDGFGTPIHYDNTADGRFEPQSGDAHMPAMRDHPPDPRESVDYGAVDKAGIQNSTYDLWSHGDDRHQPKGLDLSKTIGNWSVKPKQQ